MSRLVFSLGQSESARTFDLQFQVRSTPVARKCLACLQKANSLSSILEPGRWYNFKKSPYANLEILTHNLNQTIDRLNQHHPGLITEVVDKNNLQQSINRLHVHFADSHLVHQRITEASYPSWFEFNNLLHAFEAVQRSQDLSEQNELPNYSMVLTWKDNFKTELNDEDYSHFTIAKKFGTIYVNYCQVGRHLFEMFQAQDHDLAEEHILPLKLVSADSYFWFGPSSGKSGLEKKYAQIEAWFKQNEELFRRRGLGAWGDPRLAIGWLPVADLDRTIHPQEPRALTAEVSNFDHFKGCSIFE